MITEISGLMVEKKLPDKRCKKRKNPILFVHGMWGGSWMFNTYLDFFSNLGYESYALNLRGHNGSTPVYNIGGVSIYDYLSDTRIVFEKLNKPILVGHSMGGLIVQKLAEMFDPPAIVAISPNAPRGIRTIGNLHHLYLLLRHGLNAILYQPMLPAELIMNLMLFSGLPSNEQAKCYQKLVPESAYHAFEVAITGVPVDEKKINCPILIVAAAKDQAATLNVVHKIVRKYKADFLEYKEFAHMIMFEKGWETVAQDIFQWLDKNNL